MAERTGESRIQTACLLILTGIAIAVGLYWLESILVPFVLAVFVAAVLTPVVDFQVRRLRFPRFVAILGTLVLVLLVMLVVSALVSSSVARLAANASQYGARVEELVDKAVEVLPMERLGVDPETEFDVTSYIPEGAAQKVLVTLSSSVMALLSNGLIVLMFVLFLLLGAKTRTQPRHGVLGEVEVRVKRYIGTKVVLSAITGFLVFLIFQLLGVDFAISFGAFAFLLNFIPNIGSLIATILPLPIVLLTPGITPVTIILAIALPGAVQFLVGNIIEPKLMGESMDLHPVVVLLSLMFWGMLWGIVGMLLAVPITAIIRIVLGRMEQTAAVARLLAGHTEDLESDG